MTRLSNRGLALSYLGGKAKTGRWIANQLPQTTDCTYIEPFAGMLGVLLQRPPSRSEIVNDANERIVNWWQTIRDHPTDVATRLEWTPSSRTDFDNAADSLDDPDPIVRAWALTVVLSDGFMHTDYGNLSWQPTYDTTGVKALPGRERLQRLADRIRDVQLENRDACDILERIAKVPQAVVYCDPPYRSSVIGSDMYKTEPDLNRLTELLQAQQGQVAISGYNDEWDHLGWRKTPRHVQSAVGARGNRLEHLWFNYLPEARFDL